MDLLMKKIIRELSFEYFSKFASYSPMEDARNEWLTAMLTATKRGGGGGREKRKRITDHL